MGGIHFDRYAFLGGRVVQIRVAAIIGVCQEEFYRECACVYLEVTTQPAAAEAVGK
jgi:hypothetical protein